MKGEDLIYKMKENHLISKGGKVHIVFSNRICRPSMIDGTPSRGEKEWEILGELANFSNYIRDVRKLNRVPCKHCLDRLERDGIPIRE